MFRNKVVYSPVELDYLKANRDTMSQEQLSLALAKSRNSIKNKLLELDGKTIKKPTKRTNIGKRKDLNGLFVRSSWEANYLRYLKYQSKKYKYEPQVFPFLDIKHGTTSYCPDIYIPEDDTWIEIKGMLDGRSKTQIRRFKKYYPEDFKKLRAVVGSSNTKAAKFFESMQVPIVGYYNELNKEYKNKIKGWE